MARIIDFCIIFSKLFPRSKSVSVFYVYLCTIFIHDMKYENTFKAIDQILWKEQGCGSELDYLEQKSWMLFLKYLDDLETEREEEAELEGKIYKRLVTGYYRWSQWATPKRRDPPLISKTSRTRLLGRTALNIRLARSSESFTTRYAPASTCVRLST